MLTNAKAGSGAARPGFVGNPARRLSDAVCVVLLCFLPQPSWLLADDLPPVETFEMGPWTLYAAREPFRVSWFHKGKLAYAERYRRGETSIQVLKGGRWIPAGPAKAITRESDGHVAARVEIPGVGTVSVELTASSSEAGALARWSVDAPGADAVRDEIVPAPGEEIFAVSGTPRLAISSRGYAIWVSGVVGSKVTSMAPDPDSCRVEAGGQRLAVEIWPASPKEALKRRALAAEKGAKAALLEPAALEVKDWASLRAVTASILADSLSTAGVGKIVLAGAAKEGELHARAQAVIDGVQANGGGRVTPLFVEYPDEREAWRSRDEWLIGADTLIAPVLRQSERRRKVWLPPGNWRRQGTTHSGDPVVRGPAWIEAEVPLGEAALFIRS